jgi:hypothetical protein
MHPSVTASIQNTCSSLTPSNATIAVTRGNESNTMNQLPEIPVLETDEMWSQRAIDTPEEVLEELKKLKQQQPKPDVYQ